MRQCETRERSYTVIAVSLHGVLAELQSASEVSASSFGTFWHCNWMVRAIVDDLPVCGARDPGKAACREPVYFKKRVTSDIVTPISAI